MRRSAGYPVTTAHVNAAFQRRSQLASVLARRGLVSPTSPRLRNPAKWTVLASLDLAPITAQMVDAYGWSRDRAEATAGHYRRFLYLITTNLPHEGTSPTPEIDEFWHRHILNTEKYRDDCLRFAGAFLHHDPCGESAPASVQALASREYIQTIIRWESEFGDPYPPEETLGEALLNRPACLAR